MTSQLCVHFTQLVRRCMEVFVLDLNPFAYGVPLDTLYHMIVNFSYLTPDISQRGVCGFHLTSDKL
jgi:hypothetical protein